MNQKLPRFDRLFAKLIGWSIYYLGYRANVRGDNHNFQHALWALRIGSCSDKSHLFINTHSKNIHSPKQGETNE